VQEQDTDIGNEANMSSYTYPAPKDTVWHKSGAIDADGLSEEWLTVCQDLFLGRECPVTEKFNQTA